MYKPEKGLAYESGLKLDLFDSRIGVTIALFQIDKEHVITTDALGDSVAAGKARSQGLDLQFSGQVTDALRVIGAYAYIDAEVTKGDAAIPKGRDLLGMARNKASEEIGLNPNNLFNRKYYERSYNSVWVIPGGCLALRPARA